ncbi:MAG: hypothetical protein LBH43_01515 [Treponema sp.]|jgi:DNA-directed RNA polymerase alpha subunit|nr:hypothetical protein [Treponema sp.]
MSEYTKKYYQKTKERLKERLKKIRKERDAESIRNFGYPLSFRAFNILGYANIKNIRELSQLSEYSVYRLRNVGKKTIAELKSILERNGLSFKTDAPMPIKSRSIFPVMDKSPEIEIGINEGMAMPEEKKKQ